MPVYSSLQIDIGERFQRTMPLPLRPHIPETLYRGFVAEMDDICESIQWKKILAKVIKAVGFVGGMFGFALFVYVSFLDVEQFGPSAFIVAMVIFIGSPLLGMGCASCLRCSSAVGEIQRVCEDYSRRFGTVTVHYRVDAFNYRDSDGNYQTSAKEYLEFHYPNDKC
jgi:hypothetical protein